MTAVVGDTVKAQLVATDPDVGDVLTFSSTNLPRRDAHAPGQVHLADGGASPGSRVVPFTVNDGTANVSCSMTVTLSGRLSRF
jgi:hypothetical protein